MRLGQAYYSQLTLFNAPKYTLYQTSTGPRSSVRIERWIPGSKCPGLRNQFINIYSRRPHLQKAHIERVNRCWALVKVCFGCTKCTSVVIAKPQVERPCPALVVAPHTTGLQGPTLPPATAGPGLLARSRSCLAHFSLINSLNRLVTSLVTHLRRVTKQCTSHGS